MQHSQYLIYFYSDLRSILIRDPSSSFLLLKVRELISQLIDQNTYWFMFTWSRECQVFARVRLRACALECAHARKCFYACVRVLV
jgi:hypothetical protein